MDSMRPPLPSSSPEQDEFEIRWRIDMFYQNELIISRFDILTMEINAKLGALAGIFDGGRGATGGDLQRNRGGEREQICRSLT